MGAIGLIEGLPDRGGHNGVLALRDMRQGVAHPMHPAALPGRLEYPRDGGLEPRMRVADHQPDATEAAGFQGA